MREWIVQSLGVGCSHQATLYSLGPKASMGAEEGQATAAFLEPECSHAVSSGHLSPSTQMTVNGQCASVGGTPGCGWKSRGRAGGLLAWQMWFESADPDRQVRNLGKLVVGKGNRTANVSGFQVGKLWQLGAPLGRRDGKDAGSGC